MFGQLLSVEMTAGMTGDGAQLAEVRLDSLFRPNAPPAPVVHILKQLLTICHGHMTLADGSLPGSVLPYVLQGMASYLDAAAVQ
jgi:hypothetical protein